MQINRSMSEMKPVKGLEAARDNGAVSRPDQVFDRMKSTIAPDTGYTLRISTFGCNFRCTYCSKGKKFKVAPVSRDERLDIIKACVGNGIYINRWTGGEPTALPDFVDIVSEAQEAGVRTQMLSTNGSLLAGIDEDLRKAGIVRVNISLDTLDRDKFAKITGRDMLPKVLQAIERSVGIFELTKINCVLQKSNLDEMPQMIDFLSRFRGAPKPIVLRYIELVKGGFLGDTDFVEAEHCTHKELTDSLKRKYGVVEPVKVEGDNPMCYYLRIPEKGVTIGLVPNFSTNYSCGGVNCRKLRLNPTGVLSNCSIYQHFSHDLRGTTFEQKMAVVKHLVEEKMARTEVDFAQLKHYQTDYQFWRFGAPSSQVDFDDKGPERKDGT